jgi:hypothetical protein
LFNEKSIQVAIPAVRGTGIGISFARNEAYLGIPGVDMGRVIKESFKTPEFEVAVRMMFIGVPGGNWTGATKDTVVPHPPAGFVMVVLLNGGDMAIEAIAGTNTNDAILAMSAAVIGHVNVATFVAEYVTYIPGGVRVVTDPPELELKIVARVVSWLALLEAAPLNATTLTT